MSGPAKICIVVPTYNEALNIGDLVRLIFSSCDNPGLEICVVDDSSPDGTATEVRSLGDPRVQVLVRTQNRGYGPACNEGIQFALARGASLVITMDADFQHSPVTLNDMIRAAEQNDLVIGSRYLHDVPSIKNWPLWRQVVSRCAGAYLRAIMGVAVTDPSAGFRCWRSSFLRAMPLDRLEARGYAYLYETLFVAARLNARVVEVENLFQARTRGESKISWHILFEGFWLPLRLRLKWMFNSS